jgi:hypothetical protein
MTGSKMKTGFHSFGCHGHPWVMRGFTRLTNAFSKKAETDPGALALHFMQLNYCCIHKAPRRRNVAPPSQLWKKMIQTDLLPPDL